MALKVKQSHKNQGFTLVEVAIVMLISGLLTAAASAALTIYIKKARMDVTNQRLDAINEALQTYLNQTGAYPCAAPFTSPIDDVTFGVAVDCTTAPGIATVRTAGTAGRNVRIGSVPVRTLNLPDDYIADSWGGRFTYAVTEDLTDDATYDADNGAIRVIDSAGNDVIVNPAVGTGHYVVVSHGSNLSGAVPTNGGNGAVPVCPPPVTNSDAENCNRNSTFLNTILVSEGANRFDDMLRARSISPFGAAIPSGAVMAFNLTSCPQGWSNYANADGRVVVGFSAGYALNSPVGNNDDTLTLGEMGYGVTSNGINPTALISTAAGGVTFLRPVAGGPLPHDTRQAYVALRYCEKN